MVKPYKQIRDSESRNTQEKVMKPLYVVLTAIATAIVGGGIGFVVGAGIGGIGGIIGGVPLGACAALNVASEQRLVTPEQATQILGQMKEKLGKDFNLKPEDLAKIKLNCDEILKNTSQPSQ
jgi:hypothetical protein